MWCQLGTLAIQKVVFIFGAFVMIASAMTHGAPAQARQPLGQPDKVYSVAGPSKTNDLTEYNNFAQLEKPPEILLQRPFTKEEIFFHRHLHKARTENPASSDGEIGRILGAQWQAMRIPPSHYGATAYALEKEWIKQRIDSDVRESKDWQEPTLMAQWYCNDGTFNDAIRAPEAPQGPREWYKRSLICEAIKENRTGMGNSKSALSTKASRDWFRLSGAEKEPFISRAEQQRETYLDDWQRYGVVAAEKNDFVPVWILPCPRQHAVPKELSDCKKERFSKTFGRDIDAPPEYPKGRRSPFMIYYKERICEAVHREPAKSICEYIELAMLLR